MDSDKVMTSDTGMSANLGHGFRYWQTSVSLLTSASTIFLKRNLQINGKLLILMTHKLWVTSITVEQMILLRRKCKNINNWNDQKQSFSENWLIEWDSYVIMYRARKELDYMTSWWRHCDVITVSIYNVWVKLYSKDRFFLFWRFFYLQKGWSLEGMI